MATNRRTFLKNSGLVLGAASLTSLNAEALSSDFEKITILHTNDVHSHIDPFPKKHSRHANEGGVVHRSALIKTIRKEEKNVLLLDAGDIFQGTPYFNLFNGQMEYDVMNYLKYDAATIGNHDFDIGIDGLINQLDRADFSMINSNYIVKDTALENKVIPNKIFQKSGIKIGIFGIGIELAGLVPDQLCKGVVYQDPVKIMLQQEKELKEKGCDIIICLSHLGFSYKTNKISDQILAQNSKFTNLIIGGHTHTFLDAPKPIKNSLGNEVIINQAGWAGLQLGRVEFYVEKHKKTALAFGKNITIG
ncbi:MAG: bifunctional metallophosphatase/5'-nucleotidase [Flavobacteriales bacterium]